MIYAHLPPPSQKKVWTDEQGVHARLLTEIKGGSIPSSTAKQRGKKMEIAIFIMSFVLGGLFGAAIERIRYEPTLEDLYSAAKKIKKELATSESLYESWLEQVPERVRKVARNYTPGELRVIDGEDYYVIGFESKRPPRVLLSPVNPFEDYEGSQDDSKTISLTHEELIREQHMGH